MVCVSIIFACRGSFVVHATYTCSRYSMARIWITVGQGPTVLAVGAGLYGHVYSHLSFFSFLFLPLFYPSFLSSFSLSLGDGTI